MIELRIGPYFSKQYKYYQYLPKSIISHTGQLVKPAAHSSHLSCAKLALQLHTPVVASQEFEPCESQLQAKKKNNVSKKYQPKVYESSMFKISEKVGK